MTTPTTIPNPATSDDRALLQSRGQEPTPTGAENGKAGEAKPSPVSFSQDERDLLAALAHAKIFPPEPNDVPAWILGQKKRQVSEILSEASPEKRDAWNKRLEREIRQFEKKRDRDHALQNLSQFQKLGRANKVWRDLQLLNEEELWEMVSERTEGKLNKDSFKTTLDIDQLRASLFAFIQERSLLFLSPGFGKTLLTLVAIKFIRTSDTSSKFLLSVPDMTIAQQWVEQARDHGVGLRMQIITDSKQLKQLVVDNPFSLQSIDVLICKRGVIEYLFRGSEEKKATLSKRFDIFTGLVVDESHQGMRNVEASTVTGLLAASSKAKYTMMLTGTPLNGDKMEQIFPHMVLAHRDSELGHVWDDFIDKFFHRERQGSTETFILKDEMRDELFRILTRYMLRIPYEPDCAEYVIKDVFHEVSSRAQEGYNQMKARLNKNPALALRLGSSMIEKFLTVSGGYINDPLGEVGVRVFKNNGDEVFNERYPFRGPTNLLDEKEWDHIIIDATPKIEGDKSDPEKWIFKKHNNEIVAREKLHYSQRLNSQRNVTRFTKDMRPCKQIVYFDDCKVAAAMEFIKNFKGRKLIVVPYSIFVERKITKLLAQHNINALSVGDSPDKKADIKNKFIHDRDVKVLVGSYSRVCTGLDGLQHICSDTLLLQPTIGRCDHMFQLLGRLWRRGQKGVPTFYCLRPLDWEKEDEQEKRETFVEFEKSEEEETVKCIENVLYDFVLRGADAIRKFMRDSTTMSQKEIDEALKILKDSQNTKSAKAAMFKKLTGQEDV